LRWRKLLKSARNAAAFKKMEIDENRKIKFENLRKIQKLPGQFDKKNSLTFTTVPNKMSS
jgi:hypothetical protein